MTSVFAPRAGVVGMIASLAKLGMRIIDIPDAPVASVQGSDGITPATPQTGAVVLSGVDLLPRDGSRQVTADFNLAGHALSNASTVNGVPLIASGNPLAFLAQDGVYKTLPVASMMLAVTGSISPAVRGSLAQSLGVGTWPAVSGGNEQEVPSAGLYRATLTLAGSIATAVSVALGMQLARGGVINQVIGYGCRADLSAYTGSVSFFWGGSTLIEITDPATQRLSLIMSGGGPTVTVGQGKLILQKIS